jgi:hypothetical protein
MNGMSKNESHFIIWLKKQNAGLYFSILFILFSTFYLVKSFDYPYFTKFGVGPGFFPRWVSALALVTGILYLIFSVTKDKFTFEKVFPDKQAMASVFLVIAAIIVFILIAEYTGFVVAGSLMLFTIFIRQYSLSKSILYAILVTVICFLIFKKGFSVPLPVNGWGF